MGTRAVSSPRTPRRHARSWVWSVLVAIASVLVVPAASNAQPVAVDGGIRFTYADPNASSVSLAGEFNGWSTTANPMTNEDGVWAITVPLEAGQQLYKFVVDGNWIADPTNPVTAGDYGNSAITIAADGSLTAMAATSNTTLSPKVVVTGRSIGDYVAREADGPSSRYELRRPTLDIDLDFAVRVNDDLSAHVLTNIHNEADNVDFYQTRLNFDRGSLRLSNDEIDGVLWDNEGVGRFDDPLRLVGGIGIYDHDYGYETVGAWATKTFRGVEAQLLYSDDSEPGGFTHPGVTETFMTPDQLVFDEGRFEFDQPLTDYRTAVSDAGKDVLAARAGTLTSAPGGDVRVGVSFRMDRSYNPGSLQTIVPSATVDTLGTRSTYVGLFERWNAFGGDVEYRSEHGPRVNAELLWGESVIEDRQGGVRDDVEIQTATVDGSDVYTVVSAGNESDIGPRGSQTLDESVRAFLGLTWPALALDVDASLSWELQRHDLTPIATTAGTDLTNDMNVLSASIEREWDPFPGIDRPVAAAVDVEQTSFSYDEATPWGAQMWFDQRNFWLENGEHEVSYERLTLLGGNDASVIKPHLAIGLHDGRQVELAYHGTFAGAGVGKTPSYVETLVHLTGMLAPRWRGYVDTRIASYDSAILDLNDSFVSTFIEIAYLPTSTISIAFSYGVDPYVIDAPVNEYDYIGRDLFLFERGANGSAAQTNYLGLGDAIVSAERALEDERRFQLEAIVRY